MSMAACGVRKSLLASLLAITLLAVSGCAEPERGQTLANAAETISAVEGLKGDAKSGGTYAGWVFERFSTTRATVAVGYEIQDRRALAVWLIQTAWSLNEDQPNQGVTASITFADRGEFERWMAAKGTMNLPPHYALSDADFEANPSVTISVPARFTQDAGLGPWPGEVPAFPENAIKKAADE